jgi:DNA-binding LacI/PurR family transcriptional regulator
MVHTMREVAKRAGVSLATVSRVLNNTKAVSDDVRQRVLDVVNKFDYVKNVHAKRLSTGRSDLFGLVISEIANPFFAEIIRGFQATAWARGYDVLLCNTEYDAGRTDAIIRKLRESDVRGVAIATATVERKVTRELTAAGIPLVFFNSDPAVKFVSNICIEYEHGVNKAIQHVVDLGHSKCAVIAGPADNRIAVTIKNVLVSGLTSRGLEPVCVLESNYRVDAGASAVREVLSRPEIPTMMFCGNDLIAMGAMSALEESGVRVPEDVSVLGIDDIFFAYLARPPLTTIKVPREQLGIKAFEALNQTLNAKRHQGSNYILGTDLVVRKSTAAARRHSLRVSP